MTRVPTILAAVAALAVSAAPVASAGPSKKPPPRGAWTGIHEYGHINNLNASGGWDPLRRNGFKGTSQQRAIVYNGHAGLGANSKTDGDVARGVVTDNKDPDKLGAVRTRGSGVIASVNVKYT